MASRYLFFYALTALSINLSGQDKFKAIKLFSGYDYSRQSETVRNNKQFDSSGKFDLLSSISFSLGENLTFHEIELYQLKAGFRQNQNQVNGITTNGEKVFETEIFLRYSYNIRFSSSGKRFSYILGAGLSPYYMGSKSKPLFGNSFERKIQEFGFTVDLFPRINYSLSSRVFVELNFPISLFGGRIEEIEVEDPSIPVSEQDESNWNSNLFPTIFRPSLGLGVSF